MSRAIKNALRIAKQTRYPVRFHQTIARHGYATDGGVNEVSQDDTVDHGTGEVSFAPDEAQVAPPKEQLPMMAQDAPQQHLEQAYQFADRPQQDPSAFVQQQLNTGEKQLPQTDVAAGEHTAKQAALFGAGMAPGAGVATAAGKFPTAEGGYEPSMKEDWQAGRYGSAALKGLGAAGDVAYAAPLVGTAAGAALKAPLAAKMAMAVPAAAKVAGNIAKAADPVADALRSAEKVKELTAAPTFTRAAEQAPMNPLTSPLTGAFAPEVQPVRGQTQKELAKMQKSELNQEQMNKLSDLRAQNPAFDKASKFLTPNELSVVIDNPNMIEPMSRMLDVIPSAAHFSAVQKAGAPKQGWYRGSTQAIIDVFGNQDAPRFAALLAATSPQTSVESNLHNALNIWREWDAAGRPTDPRQIKSVMGSSVQGNKGEESVLGAWFPNTVRALTTEDPLKTVLSGPKVDSFYRNLADDVYRVTNDAWMANGTGINQNILRQSPTDLQLAAGNPGLSPTYLALNARQREAAQRSGMFPSEGQETAWSFFMPLMENQTKLNLPAREILQKGLLTPELIKGTPDFATLLKQPAYADILKRAGYEDQLSKLRPHETPTNTPSLSAQEQRYLDRTAQQLETLRDLRNRESRTRFHGFRPPESTSKDMITANMPHEAITGEVTGHLPGSQALDFKKKESFTGKVNKILRDMNDHDVINKALGLATSPNRPTTGMWSPEAGKLIINPSQNAPVEMALNKKGMISPKDQATLKAAATLRGAMTAQEGSPIVAQKFDPSGPNVSIPLKKKTMPPEMEKAASFIDPERAALADTGVGVHALDLGEKLNDEKAAQLSQAFGAEGKFGRTSSAMNDENSYVDLSKEFKAPQGSRGVTNKIVQSLNELPPKALKSIGDSVEVREMAGKLFSYYDSQADKLGGVRPDLMNMLSIIRDKGVTGLEEALKDPKQLLPALAAIGLGPAFIGAARNQSEVSAQPES
jgi:hypothetical protein